MAQSHNPLSLALIPIARPTFDVALAQAVTDEALALLEALGCTVIGPRNQLLMDSAAAQATIAELATATFDLLILFQASFADSSMAVEIVQGLRHHALPVLLWAVPDRRDGGRLRLNSLCGINLAGHALQLRELPYDYLLSPPTVDAVRDKLLPLAQAGRARRQLQGAHIGLVGEHPVGFDTCAYDAPALAALFGVTVAPVALAQTLAAAAQVDEIRRQAFVDQVATYAHNLAELDQGALQGTAGVYGALRALVDEQQLQGVAVRCWPEFFTELGCAACGAMGLLNEEQCPASCEADVNGTVTSLLLQAISGEAAFVTDLVSIDEADDTGVLWHCGLAPVSMADPAAPILGTVHSNRKLPLLLEFPLKPGRVTIARLHRLPSTSPLAARVGYQLVIGGGEMLRAPKSFSGTSGVVRFDQRAAAVLDTVMRHGLEHHFCLTYGDHQAALAHFATLVGLPILRLT